MTQDAVTRTTAGSLVTMHLRGLAGDPLVTEAYERLARVIMTVALSVEHARATLESFQDGFPSPRELKDALYNSRVRFQEPEPPPARPEPDIEFHNQILETLAGKLDQFQQMRVQAIQDMLYYTEGPGKNETHDRAYWTTARIKDLRDFPALVSALRAGRTPTAEEIGTRPVKSRFQKPGPSVTPPVTDTEIEAEKNYRAAKEQLREQILEEQQAREIEDLDRESRQQAGDYQREPGDGE